MIELVEREKRVFEFQIQIQVITYTCCKVITWRWKNW